MEECGQYPVFASFNLAFALQLRKNHGKTSIRLRKTSVRLSKNSVSLRKTSVRLRKACQVKKNLSQVKKNLSQVKKNLSQVKKNLGIKEKIWGVSSAKQNIIHPACKTHAPSYIAICGLCRSTIFSTLSHKRHDIGKKVFEPKMYFDFLYKFCLKYFSY